MTAPLIVGRRGQLAQALLAALPLAIATSHGDGETALDLFRIPRDPLKVDALLETYKPSMIYCAGAMTDVEWCEREPERAVRTNSDGPSRLASAAARFGVPFIYFSSDYVFDGAGGPYTEDAVPRPLNAYGLSKYQGEVAVLDANPNTLIIRTTGLYGPDLRRKNFVFAVWRALAEGRKLAVPYDQLGTPTYVPDLAAAAIALVRCGARGIVHVAGPELLTRSAFALQIATLVGGNRALIVAVKTASLGQCALRPLRAGLSSRKLQRVLPGFAMSSFEQAYKSWSYSDTDIGFDNDVYERVVYGVRKEAL